VKPVSIVIPNYNGRALMERCLPSVVRALEAHPPGGELIVVDDGSSDGSAAWLAGAIPGAKVKIHAKNRGFAAACTTGIDAAAQEIVILLNTDVEARPDFIAPLVRTLEGEGVFAAGCLALDEDGRTVGENLKVPRLRFGKLKFEKFRKLDKDECQARIPRAVPTLFATGGFMALKRSLFFSLGGFDPLFEPFYYEDADLCYRAWKRGYRVLVEPASVVIHRHKGSILEHHGARRVARIQERNRLLLIWKNLTSAPLFYGRHLAPLLCRCAVKWLVLDVDFYLALFGALGRLRAVRRGRRIEKREAKRTDGDLFREIGGQLSAVRNGLE
jgi:GT2 family glycosyltransferase